MHKKSQAGAFEVADWKSTEKAQEITNFSVLYFRNILNNKKPRWRAIHANISIKTNLIPRNSDYPHSKAWMVDNIATF